MEGELSAENRLKHNASRPACMLARWPARQAPETDRTFVFMMQRVAVHNLRQRRRWNHQ